MSFFERLFKPKRKQNHGPAEPSAPTLAAAQPPKPSLATAPVPVESSAPPALPPAPEPAQNASAAIGWQNVYVFISSTFNDMHAERDYLVKQVFPQVKEWCERRKLRLVDIDLRWGVTEADAVQNKHVVQVCLERIDTCRPFFLCLLGQRRGWVPSREDISAQTYADYPELARYTGIASVTEMEILHALVDPLHRGIPRRPDTPAEHYERAEHAFFYLREPSYLDDLPAVPPQLRQVYTNEAIEDATLRAEADRQLRRWRETEIPNTGRPARPYTARWDASKRTPEIRLPLQCPSTAVPGGPVWQTSYENWARVWARAGVRVDETGEISGPTEQAKAEAHNARLTQGRLVGFTCADHTLGETIIGDLQAAIEARYPDHTETQAASSLQRELDQQAQFLEAAGEGFIERAGDFAALGEYVDGPRDRLFVLTAPAGLGKTSLLAKWIDRTTLNRSARETLHYRFVGASDGSTTVDALLRSVLHEIRELTGKLASEIPANPAELRATLPKLLEAAGKNGKVVIVLDGLNQLETGMSDLAWLPVTLPANVRLIVSFKRGDPPAESYYRQLQSGGQAVLAEVKLFAILEDRRKLGRAYLSQYLKELDERHLEALIRSEGASNPLYLKVVLAELRVFGAFADLGEKIRADFGATPLSAFAGLLRRLESDPAYSPIQPELLVPHLFGWLAHARTGLTADELGGLLLREAALSDGAIDRQQAVEAVHGLLRQVRPYLARREDRVDFFYESFKLAVLERYVRTTGQADVLEESRPAQAWHAFLAGYFDEQSLHVGEKNEPNRHKLAEIAFQFAYAGMTEGLLRTLWDYRFIRARLEGFGVHTTVNDYDLVDVPKARVDPEAAERLDLLQGALRLSAHVLSNDPSQLPSQLTGRLLAYNESDIQNLLDQIRKNVKHPWLEPKNANLTPPGGPLLRTLEGHTYYVNGVALTQDRKAVSASWDKTLKIWDIDSGALLRTLEGHTNVIYNVAVTPDGRAVSTSLDGTLKVWEIRSGELLRTFKGQTSSHCVAVTSDGRVVSASYGTILVWDINSGELLRTLEGHSEDVKSIALTSDGKIISASSDHTLKVWDINSGRLYRTLEGHTDLVWAVAVTSDGKAISASNDTTLKVWDINSGNLLRTLEGHINAVENVAVTSDGRAVSASDDFTLKIWDINSGQLLTTLAGHTSQVPGIAVTSDGTVVSASLDKTLKVWDINSKRPSPNLERHTGKVTRLALTADSRVVSASWDNTLKVWDVNSGKLLRTLEGHTASVEDIAVVSNSKIVSASTDRTLRIWDINSGRFLHILSGHDDQIYSVVAISEKRIVSASVDGILKLWDANSGALLDSFEGYPGAVFHLATVSNCMLVSSHSEDLGYKKSYRASLRVWDINSRRLLQTLEGHSGNIIHTAVIDEGRIVSASLDNTLKVWDTNSGKLLQTLVGHTGSVRNVAVISGSTVVSAADDRTLRVWDVNSGELLRTLKGHTDSVRCVAVTSGGRIISASDDNSIKVWNIETGSVIATFIGDARMVCVAAALDGQTIIAGDAGGHVHFLRLQYPLP